MQQQASAFLEWQDLEGAVCRMLNFLAELQESHFLIKEVLQLRELGHSLCRGMFLEGMVPHAERNFEKFLITWKSVLLGVNSTGEKLIVLASFWKGILEGKICLLLVKVSYLL